MYEDLCYWGTEFNDFFNIEVAGISYCDGTYHIGRTASYVYVFEYIIEGSGTIVHNKALLTAKTGDAYVLKKGDDHYYYSSAEHPWTKIWFNVWGTLADNLVGLYKLDKVIYQNCNVFELFNSFLFIIRNNHSVQTINTLCAIKFHEIVSFLSLSGQVSVLTDAEIMKNYLDKNLKTEVSLEDLSQLIYKSKSQLIRIFKDKYGQTPYNYFINQKINAAKKLLQNTNMSVKQIAWELNFADEHYFSNLFKKNTNVRPKYYKQYLNDIYKQT
jgi:AraC family transcriptional regulator of arabinose operon